MNNLNAKNKKLVIIGAGGLGKEVLWVILDTREKTKTIGEPIGFIDENPARWGEMVCDTPVLGGFNWFETVDKSNIQVVCAVGSPSVRKSLAQKAAVLGLNFCTIVHPSVLHSKFVEIGIGTIITPGCLLTAQVKIGNHVYLNLNTTVGHDVVIQDYVNISPGCHISGSVNLMEGADLGTGCVVLPGLKIGKWAIVGAGAVIIKDVPDNAVVVGTPAEVIKYRAAPN